MTLKPPQQAVLDALTASRRGMRLSALVVATGLSEAAARRAAQVLMGKKLVSRDGGKLATISDPRYYIRSR